MLNEQKIIEGNKIIAQHEEIWGIWECPVCGNICLDPNSVMETICNNGHSVLLGITDKYGYRETFEIE